MTMIISRLNSQATTAPDSQLPVPISDTSVKMYNAQLIVEGGREVMDETAVGHPHNHSGSLVPIWP